MGNKAGSIDPKDFHRQAIDRFEAAFEDKVVSRHHRQRDLHGHGVCHGMCPRRAGQMLNHSGQWAHAYQRTLCGENFDFMVRQPDFDSRLHDIILKNAVQTQSRFDVARDQVKTQRMDAAKLRDERIGNGEAVKQKMLRSTEVIEALNRKGSGNWSEADVHWYCAESVEEVGSMFEALYLSQYEQAGYTDAIWGVYTKGKPRAGPDKPPANTSPSSDGNSTGGGGDAAASSSSSSD